MRMLQFLTLAMLMPAAVSLQADSFLIQDSGGTISITSTSPRVSGNSILAPNGAWYDGCCLPDRFDENFFITYPGGLFIADAYDGPYGPLEGYGATDVPFDVYSYFGQAVPCSYMCTPASSIPLEIIWSDGTVDTIVVQYVGPEPMGTITGRVFNNLPDYPTDPGLAGQTVDLLVNGGLVTTTTTDANGNYSFAGLPPGTYEIQDPVPLGVTQAFLQPSPDPITLAWDQTVTGVDFGDGYFGTGYVPEPSSIMLLSSVIGVLGIGRLRLHSRKQ
jgi:hypothetical protein